jgi:hypothetical protein
MSQSPAQRITCLYRIDRFPDGLIPDEVVQVKVTKVTARRVYFTDPDDVHRRVYFVDRRLLETDRDVWHRPTRTLYYLDPPQIKNRYAYAATRGTIGEIFDRFAGQRTRASQEDISRLRAEMADAHPDRGGTAEDFMAARQRYLTARRRWST